MLPLLDIQEESHPCLSYKKGRKCLSIKHTLEFRTRTEASRLTLLPWRLQNFFYVLFSVRIALWDLFYHLLESWRGKHLITAADSFIWSKEFSISSTVCTINTFNLVWHSWFQLVDFLRMCFNTMSFFFLIEC